MPPSAPSPRSSRRLAIFLSACATAMLASTPATGADPGRACAGAAARRLDRCVGSVARRTLRCVEQTRLSCDRDDPRLQSALDALEKGVRSACSTPGAIAAAGLGDALSIDGLVARLRESCTGEVASLTARSFGGPHAGVYGGNGPAAGACMEEAFERGSSYLRSAFRAQSRCVRRHRAGRSCDLDALRARLDRLEEAATARVERACTDLSSLVLLDAREFFERAAAQTRCLIPAAHGDGAPLNLDCGPRASIPVPPRASATQVVLDESVWGTRCGDGSPYAFWIRLAPDGSPPENVVVHMQGGGVCLFDDDCRRVSSGLFRALDNTLATGGYMSNTNAANPFRDWTKVYLPYCTQDLHIGGGTTSVFPNVTVHRYGARNVRAALRYVRDLLWAELDRTAEGYRADRPRVVFGGTSAGGFGSSFNYHYLIDDLRWPRTTAVPGAALGLDNGEVLGMRGLQVLLPSWGAMPMLPPYCAGRGCTVVPRLQELHSARLGAIPEQQILNVSNQVDNTQVGTTYFDSLAAWIDALRVSYCENQGLSGVRYFLPAVPTHIHGILGTSSQFPSSLTSDGVTVGEWLGGAIADPMAAADRVEEGDLATRYGVSPFPCDIDGDDPP